jgi:chlorobactene glucosyltransferase
VKHSNKRRALVAGLPVVALGVASGIALWQGRQARRCVNELRPPTEVALPASAPQVIIILPVRNEAAHIDDCLASLTAQDYPDFSILVIDDGSSDCTPQLLAQWRERDPRIHVQRVEHLPPGWAGKAHALHLGVTLAEGEWLLFTDADTRHEPHTLRLMMGHALAHQDDLLTMGMNVMTLSGPATPLLVPLTEVLLAHRVTPAQVQNPTSRRAFAFGQYILLRKASYLRTGGYDTPEMRSCAVEDLALAEQLKHNGQRIEVVNGRGLLHNRQWTTWQSAFQGWSKSCYSEIIRSHIPLGGLPIALALIAYGLGPLGTLVYLAGMGKMRRLSFWLAALTILAQIETKGRFDRQYGLSPLWALTAPLAWIISGVMALDVTLRVLTGRRGSWKGRRIPRQQRARSLQFRTIRQSFALAQARTRYEDSPSAEHSGSATEG